MPAFSDMNMRPGQPVQLQLTRSDHARLYSLLIGYLAERAVIVTTPALSLTNDAYSLIEGEAVVCRAFSGRRAFAFQTDVLRIAQAPFPHLYLRYPQQIEAVVVRKATRVPFRKEITLRVDGATDPPSVVVLSDLSLTGAGIEAPEQLMAASSTIELELPAPNGTLRLRGSVRRVRPIEGAQDTGRAHYGIEFLDLSQDHTRSLQGIIQEQLLDEV